MPKRLPTWLTEKQKEQLLSAKMSQRNRAILALFLYAGLRSNELRMMDRADIDFDEMIVFVRHAKRGKERYVPLHAEAAAAIDAYLTGSDCPGQDEGALFLSAWGERISNRRLRSLVKQTATKAKLHKDIHPHALRHTFAVSLLDNGENLETIRDLLGHDDIKTTSIYLHCSIEGKRAAIDRL